jgi:hypothetical protein
MAVAASNPMTHNRANPSTVISIDLAVASYGCATSPDFDEARVERLRDPSILPGPSTRR